MWSRQDTKLDARGVCWVFGLLNQQDHQPLFKRGVSSEDLEVRGRVSSTKDEAAWRPEEAANTYSCPWKVAEECMVHDYVKSAVLDVLDPSQYGAIPKPSTTQALIHMLDCWSKRTDANGAKVRAILFNYKTPFDLMNRRILVEKLCKLNLPTRIINWITDFLS